MPQISRQQLIDHKACQTQVDLFSKLFGESVEVTVDACLAVAGCFDFHWAARNLLSPSALAEYNRVCNTALAEYNRVCAPALAEYNRVCASARAEYNRVCASARAEYDRVRASAFAEAYLSQ